MLEEMTRGIRGPNQHSEARDHWRLERRSTRSGARRGTEAFPTHSPSSRSSFSDRGLTPPQIRFVEMVVDQVTSRGAMDAAVACGIEPSLLPEVHAALIAVQVAFPQPLGSAPQKGDSGWGVTRAERREDATAFRKISSTTEESPGVTPFPG